MNILRFEGKGFDLFKIRLVKFITTILTLGLLYPWGKVRELRYLYANTSFEDKRLSFKGTFGEYFKGFFQTWLLLVLITFICTAGIYYSISHSETILGETLYIISYLFLYITVIIVESSAYHGRFQYRFGNIGWDTTGFKFTGKASEFLQMNLGGIVLSSLTLGIYTPWYVMKFFRYVLQNTRFGNISFDFTGDSKAFFRIYIKGYLLSIITLGIYGIWFAKQIYDYIVSNIVVKKNDQEMNLMTDENQLEVFELLVGNVILTVFTLGIGYSWAKTRLMRFLANHSIVPEGLNPENEALEQETAIQPKRPFFRPLI